MKRIVCALIVCLWACRAEAAIAFVGSTSNDQFNNSAGAVSVTRSVTAGNLLVVLVGSSNNSSTTSKPSDTVNTYTFVDGAFEGNSSTSCYQYWAQATTTASITIAAGFSVTNWVWITVLEFSGADVTSPVDGHGNKADFNTGVGLITSSSFSPAQSTDVAVVGAFARGNGTTFTTGGSYVLAASATNGTGRAAYLISPASGAQTASMTFTPDQGSKALSAGSYLQASSGGVTARPCIIGGGLICDEVQE